MTALVSAPGTTMPQDDGDSGDGGGPAGAAKAPLMAWYALAVLIATTLFAFIDRQIINLIAPALQAQFELSDLKLGVLTGLGLALFAGAATYPMGWLADRFGRRLILGICVVVWSLSTGAAAFQNSFEGLFIATVGIAIGEAALTPIIFAMIPDLFPERQRNTANFIFFAAVLLGAAAGFGLGGAALQWVGVNQQSLPGALAAMDSWRVALIIVAVPGPLFALLLMTIRMGSSTGRVAGVDGPAAGLEAFLPFARRHWPILVCLYGAIAAYSVPLQSTFTWLPVAMPRIFGTSSASVGMQMGVAVGIATLVGLVLPAVGMKFMRGDPALRPLRMMVIFLALAILPTVLLALASAPWQIYTIAGVQLMLALAVGALMPGLLQAISPPGLRARLLAVLGIVTAIAQGLSPLMIGAVSGLLHGPRGILLAIVIVSLPSWIIGVLLISKAPRYFLTTSAEVRGGRTV